MSPHNRLTDERLVGVDQFQPLVEESGDLLLKPHRDLAANELCPVHCKKFRAYLNGQSIALDQDEDTVVQPFELGVKLEVLRGPMRMNLSVGGDQKCMTAGHKIATLPCLTRFVEEAELDR